MSSVAAAVILAGGHGRRLGGSDKPGLRVGGRSLLDIALEAVAGCPIVVVGPPRDVPAEVTLAREDPPGGGPAAGVAAGLYALPQVSAGGLVAVLAADLPRLTRDSIVRLTAALRGDEAADGAVMVDTAGRRQHLIGVWRLERLAAAVARRPTWHGTSLRELLEPLRVVEVSGVEGETADVDTPADWQRWQS